MTDITKAQVLGRNMGLRMVMLETYAPGWSTSLAKEIAGMKVGQWSLYRRGVVPTITEMALGRIAAGLGMRPVDLISTEGRVIATAIPDAWLAAAVGEEPPQPGDDSPE